MTEGSWPWNLLSHYEGASDEESSDDGPVKRELPSCEEFRRVVQNVSSRPSGSAPSREPRAKEPRPREQSTPAPGSVGSFASVPGRLPGVTPERGVGPEQQQQPPQQPLRSVRGPCHPGYYQQAAGRSRSPVPGIAEHGERKVARRVPVPCEHGRTLALENMPRNWSEQDLVELFQAFGAILSMLVERDQQGVSLRSGFVTFASADAAKQARLMWRKMAQTRISWEPLP